MNQNLVGIIGGMGPFASAGFVNTIYEHNPVSVEQNRPRLLLCSDPDIPDRTVCIQEKEKEIIVQKLVALWGKLRKCDIDKLLIPCMTSHYFESRFPLHMRRQMIHLVELVLRKVEHSTSSYLLLATKGTYQSDMFSHKQIVVPTESDQERIHKLAYEIKRYGNRFEILDKVKKEVLEIVRSYGTNKWISGCTEFHLLTRHLIFREKELTSLILDPLFIIAKEWTSFFVRNGSKKEEIVS